MLIYIIGNVDMIVIGSGTCGTLTGIARKVKERAPTCKVRRINTVTLLAYTCVNINVY